MKKRQAWGKFSKTENASVELLNMTTCNIYLITPIIFFVDTYIIFLRQNIYQLSILIYEKRDLDFFPAVNVPSCAKQMKVADLYP